MFIGWGGRDTGAGIETLQAGETLKADTHVDVDDVVSHLLTLSGSGPALASGPSDSWLYSLAFTPAAGD